MLISIFNTVFKIIYTKISNNFKIYTKIPNIEKIISNFLNENVKKNLRTNEKNYVNKGIKKISN